MKLFLTAAIWLLLGLIPSVALAQAAGHLRAGEAAHQKGDLAGALVEYSLALQTAREDGDGAAELELLLRLAAVNRTLGRLVSAGDLLGMAEGVARSLDDPNADNRVQVAAGLLALAGGDARRAEKLLRKAFEQCRADGDPAGAADAAVNLGLARQALGQGEDARKAFTAAQTLFVTLGDTAGQADALTNLGSLARREGDLQTARTQLTLAVTLFRARGDLVGEADALTNLGLVLQDLGQDAQARDLYEAALATARDQKDVERQAALLLNLGTLAHRDGDVNSAAAHYGAAEDAYAELGLETAAAAVALNRALLGGGDADAFEAVADRARKAGDGRLEALAALNAATLLQQLDPKAAQRHAQRAGQLADDLQLADVRWRVLYLQGVMALDGGKPEPGIEHLREAVDLLEATRAGLGNEDARSFLLDHSQPYQALIDALLAKGDSLGAFLYAERLQLGDLPGMPSAEGEPMVARYQQLASQQAWLDGELSAELATGEPGAERAENLRQQLALLKVEFAETVDELRASYAHFDELVRVDPEDLEAIQGDLDPGVVVLQPILMPDRVVLLVFRKDRLATYTVQVESAQVEKTIQRLTRSLRAANTFDPAWTDELCAQLGEWLVAPMAQELEGADVLVVSKSGALRQLPFALLRHQDRYLVQDIAVVGVTHVGSLRRPATPAPRFRVHGDGLLLLGNPDGTLPGAETEVQTVGQQFPGAQLLVGSSGTRDAFYQHASGKTTVHLATHGNIDPVHPNRSYLVLSGDPEGPGRLSYREIPGLAPYLDRCRLVVLSACESSLAVEADGDEGDVVVSINGMAAQFRRAGVETLVGTLWKVNDDATLQLMEEFYSELGRGTDIARALQAAQLSLIEDEQLAHPWYWAAFEVVGDWR